MIPKTEFNQFIDLNRKIKIMEFLYCPDCFGSKFTADFNCLTCQTSLLTGEKISLKTKKRNAAAHSKLISFAAQKVVSRTIKQTLLVGAGSFLFLICLAGIVYQGFYLKKAKSLKTVISQMSAQNDLNKFAVETDDQKSLTAITLTQESVKISADDKTFSNVKLLFDCVIDGEVLTRTPDEYHVTVISNDPDRKMFEWAKFEFQTENRSFVVEKENGDQWMSGDNSLEYICHRISRKELENIANSKEVNFQIDEYRGQMNFAQQQSIRSYLTATSIDSKID